MVSSLKEIMRGALGEQSRIPHGELQLGRMIHGVNASQNGVI